MQFAIYHLVDATDLSMNIPFMSVILIGTNCERLAGVSHNYMVYPWYSYLIFQFFNGLIWHALSSGQNLQFKYNHRPSTIKNYCQICLKNECLRTVNIGWQEFEIFLHILTVYCWFHRWLYVQVGLAQLPNQSCEDS